MAVANGLMTRYLCPCPFLSFPKLPCVSSSVAHGICILKLRGAVGGTELERLTIGTFVLPARRVWERYTVSNEGQHLSPSGLDIQHDICTPLADTPNLWMCAVAASPSPAETEQHRLRSWSAAIYRRPRGGAKAEITCISVAQRPLCILMRSPIVRSVDLLAHWIPWSLVSACFYREGQTDTQCISLARRRLALTFS